MSIKNNIETSIDFGGFYESIHDSNIDHMVEAYEYDFDYVDYKKTEGKVAGMAILAAGNIGFVDVQTVITQLLSYFRVITNPKAVYLTTEIFTDNQISDEDAKNRLKEMVDETLHLASKLKKE